MINLDGLSWSSIEGVPALSDSAVKGMLSSHMQPGL
jgi:hypothetical protein